METSVADILPFSEPIPVYIYEDKGYIWSPEDALRIRRDHRMIGYSIGAITEFRSQNQILGLPIELSMEEVTTALRRGCIKTLQYHPRDTLLAHDDNNHDPTSTSSLPNANRDKKKKHSQKKQEEDDYGYGDYDQEEEEEHGVEGNDEAAYAYALGSDGPVAPTSLVPSLNAPPPWKALFRDNAKVTIPLVPPDLVARSSPATWPHPATIPDQIRCVVHFDLHSLGYVLTDGTKFGGELLAYPGDPMLYHAQFVVRIAAANKALLPCVLAAHCRTSHGARKHLVIALVREIGPSALTGRDEAQALEKEGDGEGGGDKSAIYGVEPWTHQRRIRHLMGKKWEIRYRTTSPDAGFGNADKD